MACYPRSRAIPTAILEVLIIEAYEKRHALGLARPTLDEIKLLAKPYGNADWKRIAAVRKGLEVSAQVPRLRGANAGTASPVEWVHPADVAAEIERQAEQRRALDRETSRPSPYAAIDEREARASGRAQHRDMVAEHIGRERRLGLCRIGA